MQPFRISVLLGECCESHSRELLEVLLDLKSSGVESRTLSSRDEVKQVDCDLLILGFTPTQENAHRYISEIAHSIAPVPIIVALSKCDPDDIPKLCECGARDFAFAPFRKEDMLLRIMRLRKPSSSPNDGDFRGAAHHALRHLIGRSRAFVDAVRIIPQIANTDVSVLITGETGTGKELYASAIHYMSPRSSKPFIAVNCGAIPHELMENELFGHCKGAYTGAMCAHKGLISQADGGTVFFDEVNALNSSAQVKLLRFLQDNTYRPLGSSKLLHANLRVLAAMNPEPEQELASGQLRKDLYYRLNTVSIKLPALRQRQDDILLLAETFKNRFSERHQVGTKRLSPDAIQRLLNHDWPGNIRELEHVIENAVLFSTTSQIESADLNIANCAQGGKVSSFQDAKNRVIEVFEKDYIQGVLKAHNGNIARAALASDKHRRAFWELMRKHGIDAKAYKSIGT